MSESAEPMFVRGNEVIDRLAVDPFITEAAKAVDQEIGEGDRSHTDGLDVGSPPL